MLTRLVEALAEVAPGHEWSGQLVREGELTFDRAWKTTRDGNYRLHVHRILPHESLYWHPHLQPMAVLALGGPYDLRIGFNGPGAISRVVGSGPFWYELTNRDSWHAIRALGTVHSVMLTHLPPRDEWRQSPDTELLLPDHLVAAIDGILDAVHCE